MLYCNSLVYDFEIEDSLLLLQRGEGQKKRRWRITDGTEFSERLNRNKHTHHWCLLWFASSWLMYYKVFWQCRDNKPSELVHITEINTNDLAIKLTQTIQAKNWLHLLWKHNISLDKQAMSYQLTQMGILK